MREPNIHLEKVSDDNVDAIVKLRVSKEQRNYVASNNWSRIDAYLSLAEGKPYYYIWRFMIDKRFQRRKLSAKNPRDMVKLGSGANTGLPKYFLILLTKTNV